MWNFFVGCGSPYVRRSALGSISRSEVQIPCEIKFKTSSSLIFPSILWFWLKFLLRKSVIRLCLFCSHSFTGSEGSQNASIVEILQPKDQKQREMPHWGTESIQSRLTTAPMHSMILGRESTQFRQQFTYHGRRWLQICSTAMSLRNISLLHVGLYCTFFHYLARVDDWIRTPPGWNHVFCTLLEGTIYELLCSMWNISGTQRIEYGAN